MGFLFLYLEYFLIGKIVIIIFLSAALIVYIRKTNYLQKRYRRFMQGESGAGLESLLEKIQDSISAVQEELAGSSRKMREIGQVLDTVIRGVGIVRFNAFQNTGSDLSFAIAIMDARMNGVVISSIYGREESRIYAKPLVKGSSAYQLSDEELEAVRQAAASLQARY